MSIINSIFGDVYDRFVDARIRKRMPCLRVLIDRNLEQYALTAEGVVQTKTEKWGPHTVTADIYGYRAKALPKAEWPRRQIEALPTITRLAREGKIVFCTSHELKFESFRASRGWRGSRGDLFRGIVYECVPAAIERSYFWQTIDLNKYTSGEGQVGWYKNFLLKVDENQLLERLKGHIEFPDFDRQNIENLGRFRELCKYLDTDDHIRDAFHLWTAEVNNLNYFLTVDKKFINKMTRSTPLSLSTPPITPAELVKKLGIRILDPLPLSDQRFRNLLETED